MNSGRHGGQAMQAIRAHLRRSVEAPVPVGTPPGPPDEPDPVLRLLWEEVRRSLGPRRSPEEEAVRPTPREPAPRFRRD
jgi:hypothetical protein